MCFSTETWKPQVKVVQLFGSYKLFATVLVLESASQNLGLQNTVQVILGEVTIYCKTRQGSEKEREVKWLVVEAEYIHKGVVANNLNVYSLN